MRLPQRDSSEKNEWLFKSGIISTGQNTIKASSR